jgi:hypothetical protein
MTYLSTLFDVQAKSKVANALISILGMLVGTFLLSLSVPWEHVFSQSTPTGGDIPAHPVLMDSLANAFFGHASVVHYSQGFWGGFEAFQFYFPLPYLIGAGLAQVLPDNIAFKLVVILPALLLPPAFYMMARWQGVERTWSAVGSLLMITFLHTGAHRIWGGSLFSALTGMIANSWAFVFYALALGVLLKARREMAFSRWAVVLIACTMLSHFYTLFLLLLVYVVFGFEDIISLYKRRVTLKELLPFYYNALFAVLLTSWWLLPLLAHRSWASEYGADFHINFLDTFELGEKIAFGFSILVGAFFLFKRDSRTGTFRTVSLYLGLYLLLYFGRGFLNQAVFSNGRLWPGLYFLSFFLFILAMQQLSRVVPKWVAVTLFLFPIAIAPQRESLRESTRWMEWNFAGVEARPGAKEFKELLTVLDKLPAARISFESYPGNHGLFGSIRVFEMLPYLTKHTIVEGGIVNSALVPGVSYFLQCATSNSCAGWPPGSLMPEKNFKRAVSLMASLGVRYHIASRKENIEKLTETGDVTAVYKGEFLTLFKLKQDVTKVEVFDGDPIYAAFQDPTRAILAFPRWDTLRNSPIAIVSPQQEASVETVDPKRFINLLASEWYGGGHFEALGWSSRNEPDRGKVVTYLLVPQGDIRDRPNAAREFSRIPSFFVASQAFAPHILYREQQWRNLAIVLPLVSDTSGDVSLTFSSKGYGPDFNGGAKGSVFNEVVSFQAAEAGAVGEFEGDLVLYPDSSGELFRFIDIVSSPDAEIRSGYLNVAPLEIPERVTSRCNAKVEEAFHRLTLQTDCPGKPHILKYTYYPKWQSSVPLFRSVNGFMLLTPTEKKTEIIHRAGNIEWLSYLLSLLGLLALLKGHRSVRALA